MIDISLPDSNAELAQLMGERLGVRGGPTLAGKMRRGGHLLPRHVRRQAQYLADTEKLWANPRIRRTVDGQKIVQAQSEVEAHLKSVSRRDRLVGQFIGIAAPLALNFLIIFALVVTWLVWTGRV